VYFGKLPPNSVVDGLAEFGDPSVVIAITKNFSVSIGFPGPITSRIRLSEPKSPPQP
jgi:hypothetical protein